MLRPQNPSRQRRRHYFDASSSDRPAACGFGSAFAVVTDRFGFVRRSITWRSAKSALRIRWILEHARFRESLMAVTRWTQWSAARRCDDPWAPTCENAVGVDQEFHLDAREAGGSGRNFKLKRAKSGNLWPVRVRLGGRGCRCRSDCRRRWCKAPGRCGNRGIERDRTYGAPSQKSFRAIPTIPASAQELYTTGRRQSDRHRHPRPPRRTRTGQRLPLLGPLQFKSSARSRRPPAHRVKFLIDANGILQVGAQGSSHRRAALH